MHDACGVVGISLRDFSASVAKPIYYALHSLQHRGQEAAGISVHDGKGVRVHRGMGLVSEVFGDAQINLLRGPVGIGHVRYPTTGSSCLENSQPLLVKYRDGAIAIAHNGNLVNSQELQKQLEGAGDIFHSTSDTEVIAHLLVRELQRYDLADAIRAVMHRLVGSYSLVFLYGDLVIGVRDPLGIKPLCIGKLENGYMVASESVAVDTLNGRLVRDVQPGEMVTIKSGAISCERLVRAPRPAHCIFEYIYFARPDSILDGRLVYDIRVNIGSILAEEHPADADIVAPIPDSGITLAVGYHQRSGTRYRECLMKNRYVGRTFIMPDQSMRETAVRLKMNTIRPNIEGKKIVLVDDSIVRGTTSRRIVDMVRGAGAKTVHVRIGSPPIIAPCYLGIDMASREELIAAHKTVEGVEAVIDATSLGYVSLEGLVKAIGIPIEHLCTGCLSGMYPVEIPGEECCNSQRRITEFTC
ncbi:MAG: Glutamine--fructose-6-phosphate aminotransferase (isomerizing) [Methanosaeta sp. PtaB.Bin039]|nr:MAG: Glutamine--fructose-6-phosphate aminotransferase (isomerizing) [Methanosaeta sp. PtaB.Bin039]OPY44224.1 MAG: Glutamine--fructose-6-phosphate aminotransferase (isomerizing) [Methanosaeta sp. PtaU1.Bin028]HOT07245.1 amidophosphoribosyltransferase [Methanotrichaceae archaeon]HQF17273.1 amidophosphoribosyltransferase [Methanotrichaceae archaeon]HQI91846.1 amidophosphoribosyltransferase [Methanotrichaceae archaeon]